jgi:bifunctional DNA primase/polymerase-like protein
VFPLRPHSKVPAVKRWEASATTDRAQIADWWSPYPGCATNVGIACGPAGLVVLDLDDIRGVLSAEWAVHGVNHGREVLALLARWADEPDPLDTYTVLTPSGEHRYFLAPVDRRLGSTVGDSGRGLGPGVDVRAWGGAVTAAGSVRLIDGVPRWYRPDPRRPDEPVPLPRWLATRLTAPPPTPRATLRTPVRLVLGGSRLDAYVAAAVDGETAKVTNARPGVRAITVFKAAAALGELIGAGVLDEQDAENVLLDAASVHDGIDDWTPREARGHIRNGIARGRDNPRRLDGLTA